MGETDLRQFGFNVLKFCPVTLYFCVFTIICWSISGTCVRFYGLAFDFSKNCVWKKILWGG